VKKLLQKDIENWNQRLEDSRIKLSLQEDRYTENKIGIFFNESYYGDKTYKIIKDPEIDFYFAFSVSEQSKNRFFSLLEKFMSNGITFTVIGPEIEKRSAFYRDERVEFHKEISSYDKYKETKTHKIGKYLYNQYSYNFKKVKLLEIIYFIGCIEDVISTLDKYFEYDNQNEICKTTFKEGEIVSYKNDKEVQNEYLIQSILFTQEISIKYVIMKIEKNTQDIILFSKPLIVNEDVLIPNRNNQIDKLLE